MDDAWRHLDQDTQIKILITQLQAANDRIWQLEAQLGKVTTKYVELALSKETE